MARLARAVRDDERDPSFLSIFSREVLVRLRAGDPEWKDAVPPEVARLVVERQMFCHHSAPPPDVVEVAGSR
ncbi:MAG: hypothetical protein ACT4QD_06695 [Acidobacteriota bacterium]